MPITLVPTEYFFEDLKEWLYCNIDDGYGKHYEYMEVETQNEIVKQFTDNAICLIRSGESNTLTIKPKYYRLDGVNSKFLLRAHHFKVRLEEYDQFLSLVMC